MATSDLELLSSGRSVWVVTNLISLGTSSGWQSQGINYTASGLSVLDVLPQAVLAGIAAGNTGFVDFYVAAGLSDGNYADGATGTEGSFTTANRLNAKFLDSVKLNGISQVTATLRPISNAFGGICPLQFSLIAINNSGSTLSASGISFASETYWGRIT